MEVSYDKNRKEAFWETALCSVSSSDRVTAFSSRIRSLRLFLWNLQSDIWKPIEGNGEKGNIFRWKLERNILRNCRVYCKYISPSYSFPLKRPFATTVLWDLQSNTWKPIKVYGEKEISSVKNWKEAFWGTALCSVNSSHRVTAYPSRSLSLRLFLWNLQSDIWKPIEVYGEKGNILR